MAKITTSWVEAVGRGSTHEFQGNQQANPPEIYMSKMHP